MPCMAIAIIVNIIVSKYKGTFMQLCIAITITLTESVPNKPNKRLYRWGKSQYFNRHPYVKKALQSTRYMI